MMPSKPRPASLMQTAEHKNMKTILIQAVSNGWIVTERFACRDIASEPVAVFNNIRDLQTALPVLLDIVPIGIPTTDLHWTTNPKI